MKVYLKFPWKFIDSPYYANLINYPPRGVDFLGISKQKVGVITTPKLFITFNFSNIDLVHCARCLLLNKKPWVVDVEHYWNFSASSKISYSKVGKFLIEKLLKREYCKKILPWTYAAANSVKEVIKDNKVLNKIEVLYPAIPVPKFKRKKSKNITLLFIGRYFYPKGGLFVLEAFKRLKQKYDVKCTFISLTIPEQLKLKYGKFIKIYNSVSNDVLFKEIYPSSDIFVYPGFSDTFGFCLLEAMSFSIPIVSVDAFARREIIEDGENGFVIEKPENLNIYSIGKKEEKLIKNIVEKVSLLIEDSSLRKRMGGEGRKLVERESFSIKERNKKLKEIYEMAVKN
jgi:glycosyltransferase involved in cell wall biosynthesis